MSEPTGATAKAPANARPEVIRVGFVGLSTTGWASMTLKHSLLDPLVQKHFKLVAISTTNEASALAAAAQFSKEFGSEIKAYWGDASKIANDPEVDLVAISVKPPHHGEIALKAIEAGKDFFLEWQAGRDAAETRELAEKAKEKGVRSLIGLQARHGGVINKAKALIEQGKIGKVLSVTANFLMPRGINSMAPEILSRLVYTLNPENHVTLVNSPGGHFFDIFTRVVGPFSRISARGTTIWPTVSLLDEATGKPNGSTYPSWFPDHITINGILQSSGAWVTVVIRQGHKTTPGRTELSWEIDGEDGTIKIEDNRPLGMNMGAHDPEHLYLNGEEILWDEAKEGRPKYDTVIPFLRDNWLAFYKGKENGADYMDIEEAAGLRKFLAAITQSLEEDGKWVDL